MHFYSRNALDFKLPLSRAITHVHNKEGHAAKIRYARCLVLPVEANLDPKVFSLCLNFNFFKTEIPIYINQSIDLLCKLMDWFLSNSDHCHERVND